MEPDDPGDKGEQEAADHHRPAAAVDRLELEAQTDVPGEMADAVQQMIEQRGAPAEETELAEPGAPEALRQGEGAVAPGRRREKPNQEHGAEAQRHAGGAMGNRQYRGEWHLVDLKMGRKRRFNM